MKNQSSTIRCTLRALGVPPLFAVLALASGQVHAQAATFTTFDAPGAGTLGGQGTFPQSINGSGSIAGFYVDASNEGHGFVESSAGVFTSFDGPGATTTQAYSINSSGEITGTYVDAGGLYHGFVRGSNGSLRAV